MPENRLQTIAFALLATLGVLAAVLLLAGCGRSSSPSESAGSAADSALAFSRCMREHGVKDFPNPETTAGGGTTLKFKAEGTAPKTIEAAQKACQHFQEEGGLGGKELSPQQKVEAEEHVQKFAKCMREHGIEVKAEVSGGGISVRVGGPPGTANGPSPKSPAFREAQEACQGLMPGPKGGPGGPTTRTSPGSGGAGLQAESSSGGE